MTVYCVMSGEGALVSIYRTREDAEAELNGRARDYGWYIVERWVE